MKKRLIIVDVSSFIFRAFFAIRVLHAPDGTPVNAVHGVLNMMLKLFSKYKPTHLFIAKDTGGGTFRNKMYPEYKANRSDPPEELIPQFDLIKQLIEKMDLPYVAHENYEADDIIGSAVEQWKDSFDEVYIASGDKDLMQLVGGNVKMVNTMKNKFSKGDGDTIYDEKAVFEKMGVRPDQIIDYLSMVGDSSDNIPGMKGIGAKGAVKLLEEYGTLEKCIEVKDTFKGKKLISAFTEHLDEALLSKKLVTVVKDIHLGVSPDDLKYKFYPSDDLIDFLKGLGFKSSVVKLEDMKKAEFHAEDNDENASFVDMENKHHELNFKHQMVVDDETFGTLLELVESTSALALHVEYDSTDIYSREIVSLSISCDGEMGYFLPFHTGKLNKDHLSKILDATWGRETIEVCTANCKGDLEYILREGKEYSSQKFDLLQAHYIINTGSKHELGYMALEYLDFELPELDKKAIFSELNENEAMEYSNTRACVVFKISEWLKKQLISSDLEKVYYEIDDLLIPVLGRMELNGIMINKNFFFEMEKDLTKKIDAIEKKVFSHCDGEEVNLNSPKQVGELLYEKLELPIIKKTKTGISTDSEVLEELDSKNISPVPGLILQYREIGKLLSTYVKTMPKLVNKKSGRIHTSFNQYVAATGRLSSTNPNLQNIPIRTEMGRKIRKGFIAEPGKILLGADYSQVELRLLAHFSGDPVMVKAFKEDKDIHSQTASEVMGVNLSDVTRDERSQAKAVNFGLMYGQSSFGLANQLKISRREAKDYITKYFERFSHVKKYLDSLKESCERTGYAVTMMGRKRFLPDIHSSNRTMKAMAERVAINSPIQGTAADIIKLAMIDIQRKLDDGKYNTKMLLQVHDELIFEVPEEELKEMKKLVKESMENIVKLEIPLKVDMGIGVNWFDLK